ncbi:metalloendopeptidase OMA1, mitochondrial [Arapaima gigas]
MSIRLLWNKRRFLKVFIESHHQLSQCCCQGPFYRQTKNHNVIWIASHSNVESLTQTQFARGDQQKTLVSLTGRTLPNTPLTGQTQPLVILFPETLFLAARLRLSAASLYQRATVTCIPPFTKVQHFHTSGPLRALPAPLVWLVLKPLQKILAIILGRSIRKWWRSLPPNRRELMQQAAWQRRWHLAAGGVGLLIVLAIFFLTHLDEAPIMGRVRLLVFRQEEFLDLARLMSEGYIEKFKDSIIYPDDPRHKLVETLLKHLVQRNQDVTEMGFMKWSVHVVDSPIINAFVLPNGTVFVFTGLLEAVADVHQLAFVLSHEMAHALIGHAAEQASMSHVVDFLSFIALTAIWAVCPRDSLAMLGQWIQDKLVQFMFDRPYSRKLEAEADQVGLQLAAKACADVRAGPVFWQQMEIFDKGTGETIIPEWLSTHPSHKNRVNHLDRLMPQALELRASCDCPALTGEDPRVAFSRSIQKLLSAEKEKRKQSEDTTQLFPQIPEANPQLSRVGAP